MSPVSSIFIIDADAIYRAGMTACLAALPEVSHVSGSSCFEDARRRPELAECALAIVAVDGRDADSVVRLVHQSFGLRVLATATHLEETHVRSAVEAGAVGVMSKTDLTTESFVAQVRAAMHGAGYVPAELLSTWFGRPGVYRPAGGLNHREQGVLRLLADGKLTREVAQELSYSERTVKTVIRDAVTKLGASSRSQAIACAVREGLI